MINETANVKWLGGLKLGKGEISTQSGALTKIPYSYDTRFENEPGTNPEELMAAAHAACYSMFLAGELQKHRFTADSIDVEAKVKIEKTLRDWKISRIYLRVEAAVLGCDPEMFEMIANTAKINCPVSQVLRADIILDARLINISTEILEHRPI